MHAAAGPHELHVLEDHPDVPVELGGRDVAQIHATQQDPLWLNLDETPYHPEYPCGHCLSAAAAGAVIAGEFGAGAPPLVLAAEESLLRRFDTPKEYVDDVALSRIYIGVHYRFSVDAGVAMGTKVGELAAQRYFLPLAKGGE